MKTTVFVLLAAAAWCGSAGAGQTAAAGEPFVAAIETMKRSVAALTCVEVSGGRSRTLTRPGTAFFISTTGDFVTAAHVILDMQRREGACPASAISIPADKWDPDTRTETQAWFPFRIQDCRIDRDLDLAACNPTEDLSAPKPGLHFKIVPARVVGSIPPDGTPVAITGFPFGARDPVTQRANIAARRTTWQDEKVLPALLLDRAAAPGFSGSPVYLGDGSVLGIVVQGGMEEAAGMTFARPAWLFRTLLTEK